MTNQPTATATPAHEPCDPADRVTRSLLGYGIIAGPFYVAVSLAQALTRDGSDLTRHQWSLLANGDLGWIQVANFVVTGRPGLSGRDPRRSTATGPSAGSPPAPPAEPSPVTAREGEDHALHRSAQAAVRGDLLARLGRAAEARAEFGHAASLTGNARERALFLGRAAEL